MNWTERQYDENSTEFLDVLSLLIEEDAKYQKKSAKKANRKVPKK